MIPIGQDLLASKGEKQESYIPGGLLNIGEDPLHCLFIVYHLLKLELEFSKSGYIVSRTSDLVSQPGDIEVDQGLEDLGSTIDTVRGDRDPDIGHLN